MIINLNLLPKDIDEVIEIPPIFYEKMDIKNISPLEVRGSISYNLTDEVNISLSVFGEMTLIDAITKEDISKSILLEINENLSDLETESEKYFEKSKNTLDIIEFLWENIVLEVPISVTNASGIQLEGDGWSLNRENIETNSSFEKLNELFKGGE